MFVLSRARESLLISASTLLFAACQKPAASPASRAISEQKFQAVYRAAKEMDATRYWSDPANYKACVDKLELETSIAADLAVTPDEKGMVDLYRHAAHQLKMVQIAFDSVALDLAAKRRGIKLQEYKGNPPDLMESEAKRILARANGCYAAGACP